ncbi:uncharacterized protein K441DRAFT_671031 [Cenococcum geophilum 1.58]|uniref:Uncharacterized protein n=1 Tax=Cenococcum geophilum 1.58 TaxID=794803 RepID=A0ACC8EP53_9PEZI|nr:hypothetical protein K441DRAFT_671031 [Cenococcum geophilum 1.58]
MWTSDLYVLKQVKSNPLRCITQNKDKRKQYFRNMSTAMATMCDVFATVMDVSVNETKDKEKVNKNGIWYNDEYPTLQKADNEGKVNQIEATNPDGSIVFTYWVRGSEKLRRRSEPGNEPRSTCGIDDEDIPASVDEGGEFEVDW